jgi:hypothetical protein
MKTHVIKENGSKKLFPFLPHLKENDKTYIMRK